VNDRSVFGYGVNVQSHLLLLLLEHDKLFGYIALLIYTLGLYHVCHQNLINSSVY